MKLQRIWIKFGAYRDGSSDKPPAVTACSPIFDADDKEDVTAAQCDFSESTKPMRRLRRWTFKVRDEVVPDFTPPASLNP